MQNKNRLLEQRRATEGEAHDGRKDFTKCVNVKMRCNKGEIFCVANEQAFQVKATEKRQKRQNWR